MRRLLLPFLFLLPVIAWARPAPAYLQWVVDAEKASAAALPEQVKRQPVFARIWFYGQVFDLAEPRLPEARKIALQARLTAVATALDDAEAQRWLNHPDLKTAASQARGMAEAWIANSRAGDPIGPLLGWVQRPELAEAVFYRLQYRAGIALTASQLQGEANAALPLQTARHLAAGRLLATGQDVWWRHLATFHGGEVPLSGPIDADDALTRTLNARIANQPAAVRRHGQSALHLAQRRRPNSVYQALLMHLSAMAAQWSGHPRDAQTLRVQVLQRIRPVRQPELTAAVLGAQIAALLQSPEVDGAAPYLTELLALGPAVHARRPVAEQMVAAVAQIEQRLTALRSRNDPSALARALAVYLPLAKAVTTPKVAAVVKMPQLKPRIAAALAEAGALATRRGEFDRARAWLTEAAQASAGLGQTGKQAQAQVLEAQAAWRAGQAGEAGALVKTALPHLTGAPAAHARALLGAIRLAAGDAAPAFAHANAGLDALKATSDKATSDKATSDKATSDKATSDKAARAALHRLAGFALHAAGYTQPAADRLAQAAALVPTDPELARLHAVARLDLNDPDGALRALDRVGQTDAARVMRGCVLAGAGRTAEALDALKTLGRLGQPHQAWARLEGLICQIHALQAKGDHVAASEALRVARSTALAVPDPVLLWRLRVLEGADFARQDRWNDAAGVWRQAAMGLVDLGAERGARGALLSTRSLAPPHDFNALVDPLIDALVRAAEADKRGGADALKAAISIARWSTQLAAAPRGSAEREAAYRPAADRAIHRALSRLALARAALADPAIAGADRARLTRHLAQTQRDLTTARVQLHAAAPAWAQYLSPQPTPPTPPKIGLRVDYHIGAGAGHGFVMGAGVPIQHFALPDRAALMAWLKPASAVIDDAKRPADWAALAAPVPILLPFLKDLAPEGTPIDLHVSGPLATFAFEALVVDPATPTFLVERHPIRRVLVDQTPTPITPAAGLGVIGPDDKETAQIVTVAGTTLKPANPKSFQADLAARRAQWLAVTADFDAGRFSLTGAASGQLAEADLAFGPGGVLTVVASRTQGAAAAQRIVAGLHHRGVASVIWLGARADGDLAFAGRLATALAKGEAGQPALRAVQAATRAGGARHPYDWARWRIATQTTTKP